MHRSDLDAFGELLDAVCSLLSRGAYQPNPMNTALFFRSLARHSLAEVRAGFDAHVADQQRGRFVPVPADILAQIETRASDDTRLGAEEAWARAVRSADEAETVVWTDEMAQAWAVAAPVFGNGDEVGARMSFKETYNRLVSEARQARRAANWHPSYGFDPERRVLAVENACAAGLLPAPDVALLADQSRLQIGGPSIEAIASLAPEGIRADLLALRDRVANRKAPESRDAAAKRRTDELRLQAADLVAAQERTITPEAP